MTIGARSIQSGSRIRGDDRPLLKRYGVAHTVKGQLLPRALRIMQLTLLTVVIGLVVERLAKPSNPLTTITFLLAFDALLIGFWQWHAQRLEGSFETYFERLELANRRRLEYRIEVNRPQPGASHSAQSRQRLAIALLVFYAFTEMDNLEYAIRKYHLGFMDADLAERALRTFQNRCEMSTDFWITTRVVYKSAAYGAEIEELIRRVLETTRSEGCLKDGQLKEARKRYFSTGLLPITMTYVEDMAAPSASDTVEG